MCMLILFFSVYWMAPMDDVNAYWCLSEMAWELVGILVWGLLTTRAKL